MSLCRIMLCLKRYLEIHKDQILAEIALKIHRLGYISWKQWVLPPNRMYEADKLVGEFFKRKQQLDAKNVIKGYASPVS